jgi:hypothetical protein
MGDYEVEALVREAFRRKELEQELRPALEKLSAAELADLLSQEPRVFRERLGLKINEPEHCMEIARRFLEAKKIREASEQAVEAIDIARRANTHSWVAIFLAVVGTAVALATFYGG